MLNSVLGLSPIFPTPLDARELGWGLLLGKDDGFSQEIKAQTKAAGVTHLTAASGANISLFQSLLWPLAGMFWLHAGLEFAMIVLYWNLSGASGSLWRASVLAILSLGSRLVGRPPVFSWLLCLVVLMTLASEWRQSLGFWLSWLAVSGVYISQIILSGEKKNALSPRLWGFCKWLKSTLLSGSLIMVLVSIVIFRVFGEWQPQGLIGTVVSSPIVPVYLVTFTTWFLFQESNKVALQFTPGAVGVSTLVPAFLGAFLQGLLGIFFILWHWVAALPGLISIVLITASLSWAVWRLLQHARSYRCRFIAAQQWGWAM